MTKIKRQESLTNNFIDWFKNEKQPQEESKLVRHKQRFKLATTEMDSMVIDKDKIKKTKKAKNSLKTAMTDDMLDVYKQIKTNLNDKKILVESLL